MAYLIFSLVAMVVGYTLMGIVWPCESHYVNSTFFWGAGIIFSLLGVIFGIVGLSISSCHPAWFTLIPLMVPQPFLATAASMEADL